MSIKELIHLHSVDGKVDPRVTYILEQFKRCAPWLKAALKHGGNTHTLEDVLAGVLKGDYQLWPAENSVVVTEILEYPQKKIINYFLAGGKLEELREMRESVESWARDVAGCNAAALTGRKGWVKTFLAEAGYDKTYVTMTKELDDVVRTKD